MSKKVNIAIVLLIVLIGSVAAVIYLTQGTSVKEAIIGVNVGDTFTYSITGTSTLGLGSSESPGFSELNNTDYYRVAITDVNDSLVSLDTIWRFKNGTEVINQQTIDLSNGMKTDENGFWAIYASNLDKNDLLRPTGFDELIVNSTDSLGGRQTNFFSIENEFRDITDPTSSTFRYDYIGVNFDKQTGVAITINNVQQYNNPPKNQVITYQLISSSVWTVQ
jgi:hypothetical protein